MSEKKSGLLGMKFGTASNRLRKRIIFSLAMECGRNSCFRCLEVIDQIDDFTIEHKEAWMQAEDPVESFFSMENIAFSHWMCNIKAASHPNKQYFSEEERVKAIRKSGARSMRKAYTPEKRRRKYLLTGH